MFDILGAYNGKPPSPGKGGFPFSRILGGPCDFGNRWDCADVPALGPCAMLGRLGLPPTDGARAPGDLGIRWDCREMLALGPWAMLGLRGTTPKRCRWGPVII